MLNELAKEIHTNAVLHGWWKSERPFSEVVALCHSELSEALEEAREGRPMLWGDNKPEGVAVELVDCIIRILDYLAHEGVDIDHIMRLKMDYNKTRPYMHGGKKF